jgi:hypothetical protein
LALHQGFFVVVGDSLRSRERSVHPIYGSKNTILRSAAGSVQVKKASPQPAVWAVSGDIVHFARLVVQMIIPGVIAGISPQPGL